MKVLKDSDRKKIDLIIGCDAIAHHNLISQKD